MKKRAERVEQTRQRIVDAAIHLHTTVGPARATHSAIAKRAGVERQTYYRHFPDDLSLLQACTGLYMERNPLANADDWRGIEDPDERLRRGLDEMYRYYEANEGMLGNVIRDAEVHPLTAEMAAHALAAIGQLGSALAEGLPGDPRLVGAAIDVALAFPTWRSLVRESGLSRGEAVDLMVAMLVCAG